MLKLTKNITSLDKFLFCILVIMSIANLGDILLPRNLMHVLRILAIWFMVFYFYIIKKKFDFSGRYIDTDIQIVLKLLIFWNILTVTRGVFSTSNFRDLFFLVTDPYYSWSYFTPLISFIIYSTTFFRKFANWSLISIFISLIATIYYRDIILIENLSLLNDIKGEWYFYSYLGLSQLISISFGAIVFYWISGSIKDKRTNGLLWLSLFIGIAACLLLGRRSSAASLLFYLFLFFFYKIRYKKKYLIFILILCLSTIYLYNIYYQEIENAFPILFNRLMDDTRSNVEIDFYRDMQFYDYIWGRSSMGKVYSSSLGYRPLIETGYLNIILHGGIISLSLYLYAMLFAAWRGFFAKNKLCVAMSLYIIARIIFLYPGGHIVLDFSTIALWICVGCCACKKFRNMSNYSLLI